MQYQITNITNKLIRTIMKDFEKTGEKFFELSATLRNDCENYLASVLKENGGHIEWDNAEVEESLCVAYDGGNHPEYASNCFSLVSAIDMDEKGNITLDIEDTTQYDLDRVEIIDLYNVCEFVEHIYGK